MFKSSAEMFKPYADDYPVTTAEVAELFDDLAEPIKIDGEPDWNRFPPDFREIHQLAWTIVQMTRPELIAMADEFDDDTGRALLDEFTNAIDNLQGRPVNT